MSPEIKCGYPEMKPMIGYAVTAVISANSPELAIRLRHQTGGKEILRVLTPRIVVVHDIDSHVLNGQEKLGRPWNPRTVNSGFPSLHERKEEIPSKWHVMVVAILGIVGYVLRKLEYDPAPLVLAFVVGPILERTLRQSLLISGGDPSIFLTRPVSRVLVIITVLFLISSGVWEFLRNRKRVASVET